MCIVCTIVADMPCHGDHFPVLFCVWECCNALRGLRGWGGGGGGRKRLVWLLTFSDECSTEDSRTLILKGGGGVGS